MGSASAEEMKALASGNPLLPLEVKYKRQVLNYEADRANFMREQRNLRDQLKYLEGADARLAAAEKAYSIDSQARETGTGMKDGKIVHAVAWNGETLEGKALENAVRGLYEKSRKDIDSLLPLGAYRGFNLFVKRSLNYGEDGFRIIMKGKSGTHYQPTSLIFAKAKPLPDQDSHATDQINLFRRTPRGKEQEKKAAEDIRLDAKAIFARLDKAIDVKLEEGIMAARETAAKEKANADAVRGGIMDCYPKEKEYRVARANHAAIMVELEKMKSDKGYKPDWQPYTVDDNLPGTEPKLTVPNEYMRLALKGKLGLDKVPEEHRMPEFFMDAVRQSPMNLCAVPEEFQTIDICREAIRQNPLTLTYVNDQNEDVCMEAIRLDPRALAMVRDQGHELQIKAVRENPRTLEYVCANGSLSGYGHNCNIHCWPEKIPPDVALEAVRQDGMTLEFVRTHTPEIDMAAVTQNGMALKFIEEQTDALIQAATRQNPEAEKYVLEECYSSISSHTSKISREAIRNTIRRLESGDERIEWTWHQTPEIALAAVKANGENLKRVVEALKTREVVEAALEQNIGYMAYAPAGFTMEKERNAMKERAGM